mgnify:CR=1 FL=1
MYLNRPYRLFQKRFKGTFLEKVCYIYNAQRIAQIRFVTRSNYCDISLHCDTRTGTLIVCSCIDNMVKGAAGQAIQNMNLYFGLPEETGVDMVPAGF